MSAPSNTSSAAIVIRHAAMVCALSLDWRQACAALRAGLRRAAPIQGVEPQSEVDGSAEGSVGHAVTLLTLGFEGAARQLRLLAGALEQLADQWPALRGTPPGLAIYLALAPRNRTLEGADLIADGRVAADLRAAARAAQQLPEPDEADVAPPAIETDRQALISAALAAAGLSPGHRLAACFEDDDTAAASALKQAAHDLRQGTVQTALVIAADSLLEPHTVQWLANTGRLKSPGMAVGLEPGEAGVALLLAQDTPGLPALGRILGLGVGDDAHPLLSGRQSDGSGTAQALQQLAQRHGWGQQPPCWLVCDHNGEQYRAHDLAMAMVRLRPGMPAIEQLVLQHPASGLGDVGAARLLSAVVWVLAAFERHHAPALQALVLTVGDGPRRCALLLARH